DVIVVRLSGRLDVEATEPFRRACANYLAGKRVVFDFHSLSFVGSSGILPFLKIMQEFAARNAGAFKFSGVGSEFRKLLAATSLGVVEIFETSSEAVAALIRPPGPAPLTPAPVGEPASDASPSAGGFGANELPRIAEEDTAEGGGLEARDEL